MITYARVFRLSFEMPKPDGDPVIRAEIHYVEQDPGSDRIESISGTQHEIFRKLSTVFAEPVTFVSPASGETVETTVAAVTTAVTQVVLNWMPDEIEGGRFDEQGRFVVNEG